MLQMAASGLTAPLVVAASAVLCPARAAEDSLATAIEIARRRHLRITFDSVLEAANDVLSSRQELPGAVSPLGYAPVGAQRFFRARARTVESVFASRPSRP
jgi:hypothetical protein